MKKILLILTFILFGMICSFGQGNPNGWPTGGNGNGGPPPPPPNYCDANPGDPSCNGAVVPIGDWKWQLGLFLIGSAYVFYKFKKDKEYGIE